MLKPKPQDGGPSVMEPVLRRMEALAPVTPQQQMLIERLARRVETHGPRTTLQTEGEPAARPRYLLSGWACRQRLLADGRRQIFSLLLPGDGLGVCQRFRPLARATTVALTRITTADASDLLSAELPEKCPELADVIATAGSLEEGMLLNQVVRLGRQTAYERMAHLLLELNARLEVVGLASDGRFALPLTQEMLADVLGLSVVHVNRTLQQLRRERAVTVSNGEVQLLQPELLVSVSDFSPPTDPKSPTRYGFS